jgi:DNA-binding CsgD family transcriptional regulator
LYDELTPKKRRALHARLAGVSEDPEEHARHRALAAGEPDAEVADLLENAARRARSRGAPDSSAELLELAVGLMPNDSEDARTRREFALAQDLYVVGEMERARERWRELAQQAPNANDRARARCDLVRFVEANPREAERLLRQALAEAEGDIALQATIELTWARVCWWSARLRAAEEHANAAVTLAEQTADPSVIAQALAQAAVVAFHRGRPEWAVIVERGIAIEREVEHELPLDVLPRMNRALVYERAGDDVDTTRGYLHELRAVALKQGSQSALANLGFWFTWNECVAGNLDLAKAYAREGAAYAAEAEAVHLEGAYKHAFALIDALAGRAQDAIVGASEALELSANGLGTIWLRSRGLLGFVELSLGHPEASVSWLEPAWRLYVDEGWGEVGRFVPDLVESLILLGRLEEAEARLSWFETAAERLGRRWALAESKRCRGLMLAAQGRLDEAEAALERSVRMSESLGQPLLHGRALLARGTVARRAKRKRKAEEALSRAQEVFEGAGMELFAERARAERARVGLRPRAPSELTETEQRVAELAAAGRRNGEIAAELFMSVHAVEANLTRAYRKLGIRSRSELAVRLAHARRG